jgi:Omp85 superfamily domain
MLRLAHTQRVIVLVLTGLVSLVASPVSGQQSRAEEIARHQAEKSKKLAPNTRTVGERALDWFEDHFTDPNTAYLTFGGIYPTGGFAPGVAVRRAIGHARLNAGGAYSIRSYKLAHASLRFPELAGNKLDIETRARWIDATQVPFYGIGNDSIKDERVNYGLRSLEVSAATTLTPVPWYRIGAGISSRQIENREGVGRHPSIESRHSPLTAPGLFAEPRYRQATVFTAIDWRESPGYTRRGGLYAIALDEFRDRDDVFTFRVLEADLRQYIPLLKEHWVIAVRALVQTTDVDSGQEIPYYLLPSLGGANSLRGYGDFRFQDNHLLLLSAEYRWLPSRVVDMAIFVDSGKVTAERRDLDLNGLKTSYGIGIRFHGPTFTPLRVDLARGDDGIRAHVTGSVTF